MVKKIFQNIILIGRPGVPGVPETLIRLRDFLQSRQIVVSIEANTSELIKPHTLPIIENNNLPDKADLIIVVGGDGSLLNAAHIALQKELPVLGINRGRLGFLTDIYPNELEKVGEVLDGNYQQEMRFLLDGTILHEKQKLHQDSALSALNDIVLIPADQPQMIEFETYINERFVCSQRADGLIVATPTGSTAYALSGGGPILHPKLNAIVLVPMFPHTLSSRPIVIDGDSRIEIHISKSNEFSPYVSCDGQSRITVPPGGQIIIQKKSKRLCLIHPEDYSYFSTLREKLGWERRVVRGPIKE